MVFFADILGLFAGLLLPEKKTHILLQPAAEKMVGRLLQTKIGPRKISRKFSRGRRGWGLNPPFPERLANGRRLLKLILCDGTDTDTDTQLTDYAT